MPSEIAFNEAFNNTNRCQGIFFQLDFSINQEGVGLNKYLARLTREYNMSDEEHQ